MKVKIFNSEFYITLEEKINEFIEEIEKDHMIVKDIKYTSTSTGISKYTALIMYEPDGRIYLTNIPCSPSDGSVALL